MELRDVQQPLAQLQVAVKRRQVPVDAVDQARVDRDRDVRPVQGGGQRARVLARPGVEDVALHLRAQHRAERRLVLPERGRRTPTSPARDRRGSARRDGRCNAALSSRTDVPSLERDRSGTGIGVREDAVDRRLARWRGRRRSPAGVPPRRSRYAPVGAGCRRDKPCRSAAAAPRPGTGRSSADRS